MVWHDGDQENNIIHVDKIDLSTNIQSDDSTVSFIFRKPHLHIRWGYNIIMWIALLKYPNVKPENPFTQIFLIAYILFHFHSMFFLISLLLIIMVNFTCYLAMVPVVWWNTILDSTEKVFCRYDYYL